MLSTQKVVVAVRAEKKEISKTALAWALTHIVHPGDCITLLAVLPSDSKSKSGSWKLWSFAKFNADCGSSQHRDRSPKDHIFQISETCSQMVLQFNDQNQVGIRIKVVSGSPAGVVASESKKAGANWVILDRNLKEEEKQCMEELHCNIVAMKHSQPKVLRVNMGISNDNQNFSSSPSRWECNSEDSLDCNVKYSTPISSPEDLKTSFTRTTTEASSMSSSDAAVSPSFVCEKNPLFEKQKPILEESKPKIYWIPQNYTVRNKKQTKDTPSRTLLEKFVQIDRETRIQSLRSDQTKEITHVYNSDVREVVSLPKSPSAPPPLCSLCQHRAPVFGKPPRWFEYRELEEATDGFSTLNSLAESGYGSVHRGVLRGGQVVAVKRLNVHGSLGDAEFCREVGVLSCAQHRNVVMLIGFCMEGEKRILVYEYVCNGSLDYHLYGSSNGPLAWHLRFKIAVGIARGLRYLHEDCRVGCIVHRDVRPNNILLTHDFEPLVGDFGVTEWQSGTDFGATRSLGYLAPEHLEDGNITEKADVYAFGVVLKELITGQKTIDMVRANRQQLMAEWYHHFLALEQQGQTKTINRKLVDPYMDPDQLHDCSHQLQAMARAASLCLRRDPESRPPMNKVLRTLEGGNTDVPQSPNFDLIGNRSGRLCGLSSNQRNVSRGNHSRTLSQ
ncbi:non-specific serine/threonine protein kinase [Ranunculus cassubicifolius]